MNFRPVVISIIIFCITIQFQLTDKQVTVAAQTPPPASGDWIIGDTTTISGQTILLNGSLIIQNSGALNLNNCELIMNNNASKNYGIYVEGSILGGGTFNLDNTEIRSNNSEYYYSFSVNGSSTMNMKGCTIRHLGGEINLSDPLSSLGGIQIHSNNVLIEDSNITDYQTIGVMVMPYAGPTIRRCNISLPLDISGLSLTVGIADTSAGIFSPEYSDNYLSGNTVSGIISVGVPIGSTFAVIDGNTFKNNTAGVTCWGTAPDITNNAFSGNVISSIALLDSDAEVAHNDITLSGSAISILNPSTPQIHNNRINYSANGILLMNGSTANIYQNNISDNLLYGISSMNSDPTITYNDLYNNLVGGIYLDSSYSEVADNKIIGGVLSSGIVVLNDSNPEIRTNYIIGDDQSTGILLDGNGTGSGNYSNNNIQVNENGTCIDITGFEPRFNDNTFIIGKNSNGLNATLSRPTILNNYFFSSNGHIGAYIQSSSGLVQDNQFSNLGSGILIVDCTQIGLSGNTFDSVNNNQMNEHSNIEMEVINSSGISVDLEPSYLRLLNSMHTERSLPAGAKMQVDWFLDIITKRNNGQPAAGAFVMLQNQSGNEKNTLTTDSQGRSFWNQITESIFYSDKIVSHSPYSVKASLNDLAAIADLNLNSSTSITLVLDYNRGPSKPFNITPERTHNLTPEMKWNQSVDPEGDPITYTLSIGSSAGTKDILSDHITANNNYTVQNALEFRQYHMTLSAHTPDSNTSGTVHAVMDLINTPPVLQPIEDIIILIDVDPTLNFYLNGSDTDTEPVDKLVYNTTATYDNLTVDPATGEVTWIASKQYIGTLETNFSVSDGYRFAYQLITIEVGYQNLKPVAVTNENYTAYVGDTVHLNGSGSYDPDGNIVEYQWTPAGPDMLDRSDPVRPWFIPAAPGNFSFLLRVKDNNESWSLPASIYVVVLPANQKPPDGPAKLILDNARVTPSSGGINDNYVFSITVVGENITQKLIDIIEDESSPLIQLKLNGMLTLDATMQEGIYNLDLGITFEVEVPGTLIGYGEHSFRFICNYENVEGDLGAHDGPSIKEEKKKDDEKEFGSPAFLLIIIIVIIIVVIVIFFLMRIKKAEREEAPPPPPPPPEEGVGKEADDADEDLEWDEE